MSAKRLTITLVVFSVFSGSIAAEEVYRLVNVWPEAPQGWHFFKPNGVAVDKSGNVYIGDSGNYLIKKFDSEGRFLLQWGSPGLGDGQFNRIFNVKVDASGIVYVVDMVFDKWKNNRIQKFTPYGQFIGILERTAPDADKFMTLIDVAVDPVGNVFVIAWGNAKGMAPGRPVRIEKYSPDGEFIAQWGSVGTGNGQFIHPYGIAVDAQGKVYVADPWNKCIQKFTSEGTFLTRWGGSGDGDDLFRTPVSIVFDIAGDVYITDKRSVLKFTPEGKLLAKWTMRMSARQIAVDAQRNVYMPDMVGKVWKFDPNWQMVGMWGISGNADGQFRSPAGIAVDASGTVFVGDTGNNRIQKFDSQGKFLSKWGSVSSWSGWAWRLTTDASDNFYASSGINVQQFDKSGVVTAKWGTKGSGDGQFNGASGITVDRLGNVYIADAGNHRVQKFSYDGKFLAKWGTEGTANGQFTSPKVINVDQSGDILVVDTISDKEIRIQKFDPDGKFIGKRTVPSGVVAPHVIALDSSGNVYLASGEEYGTIRKYDPNGKLVAKWGKDPNELDFGVEGISFDMSGNVYVSDMSSMSIKKFDPEGRIVSNWPVELAEEGYYGGSTPAALAVDSSGNVYFSDYSDILIRKLNPDGKIVGKFRMEFPNTKGPFRNLGGIAVGASGEVHVVNSKDVRSGNPRIQKFDRDGEFVMQWGGPDTAKGQFKLPVSVAVDFSGNGYVTDKGSHRVHKYDAQGKYIKSWGAQGTGDGQFDTPEGIAVDKSGNVYVCDRQNCRIQKFGSDGKFLTKWGKEGSGEGEFHFPAALVVDKKGDVYVADSNNNRVQKFTAEGKFLTEWGQFGEAPGQFRVPLGIAVDESGNVYVSDSHNHRIQKFAPAHP
ncbi:MAG: NHL repeat-containing protein [Planctomycetota bacterium]|jgi:sugar lactone lactonase YvrE